MIRRPPRSTQGVSSAASDVYKRQPLGIIVRSSQYDDISPDLGNFRRQGDEEVEILFNTPPIAPSGCPPEPVPSRHCSPKQGSSNRPPKLSPHKRKSNHSSSSSPHSRHRRGRKCHRKHDKRHHRDRSYSTSSSSRSGSRSPPPRKRVGSAITIRAIAINL